MVYKYTVTKQRVNYSVTNKKEVIEVRECFIGLTKVIQNFNSNNFVRSFPYWIFILFIPSIPIKSNTLLNKSSTAPYKFTSTTVCLNASTPRVSFPLRLFSRIS